MEAFLHSSINWLLAALALPGIGLPAIFIISVVSATLLPLGSEPAVFAFVKVSADMFWPAVLVATVGNTLGGAISYFMGRGAWSAFVAWRGPHRRNDRWHRYAAGWLERLGPRAMLLSWLPAVGDPLCAVAGWMRFAFWPSVFYMAVGKLARYVVMTAGLLWVFPGAV